MTELQNITVKYEDKIIFSEFSHRFAPGKTTAVMGTSGIGKTTLLRVLAGLVRPLSGTVTTDGTVAFLFQEPRLCPWLTAAENVNLVLGNKNHTLPDARDRLAEVGLGADADKYPEELSGGMQQRVALARTLAYPAPLILLDEPFKGLDAETRKQMIALVRRRTAGKTVVLVTHDPSDAAELADEVLYL